MNRYGIIRIYRAILVSLQYRKQEIFAENELLKCCKELELALVSDGQSDNSVVELWDEIKIIGRQLDTS